MQFVVLIFKIFSTFSDEMVMNKYEVKRNDIKHYFVKTYLQSKTI